MTCCLFCRRANCKNLAGKLNLAGSRATMEAGNGGERMRKLIMMLLFVSLLALPAMAEEADFSRAWLDAQYESLVPAGVDAQRT